MRVVSQGTAALEIKTEGFGSAQKTIGSTALAIHFLCISHCQSILDKQSNIFLYIGCEAWILTSYVLSELLICGSGRAQPSRVRVISDISAANTSETCVDVINVRFEPNLLLSRGFIYLGFQINIIDISEIYLPSR